MLRIIAQILDTEQYLRQPVTRTTIKSSQKFIRQDNLKSHNDFQKFLGYINWLHHPFGISIYIITLGKKR